MSDLGSKAALNADIDAKVTTNGANENTGARVNDCLNNIVDTLYGSGAAPTATFSTNTNTAQDPGQDTVRFNSGTIGSVTEIALSDVVGGVDKGDLNSRCAGILQLRTVGTTETIEFLITGIVHTSWTRYTVTYLKGALPANGTVMAVRFLPSNTVNAATTAALAGKADTYSEGVKQTNVVNHQFQVSTTGGAVSVPLSALTPALATITNIQCTVLNASGAAVFACIDNNPGPSDNLTINTYAVATTIGSLLDPIIQPVDVNVWVEVTGTT